VENAWGRGKSVESVRYPFRRLLRAGAAGGLILSVYRSGPGTTLFNSVRMPNWAIMGFADAEEG
jgi:hypothetical protein